MNATLWILAILIFSLVALLPAWKLLGDPQRAQRRLLNNALRNQLIDKKEHANKLKELEAENAPRRPAVAIALFILLPVLGISIYERIGTPEALLHSNPAASDARTGVAPNGVQMDQAIAELQQRLLDDPDNPENLEGWLLLGNSFKRMQRYDDALQAYQGAYNLAPNDQNVKVELAEAILFTSDRPQMPARSKTLIGQVLETNPNHAKALWLAGVGSFQDREFTEALVYWRRLRAFVADDQARATIDEQIAAAEAALRQSAGIAAASANDTSPNGPQNDSANATEDGLEIDVIVDITEELKAQLSDGGALFIFARSPQGGPPLASIRLAQQDFPQRVTLTDAQAMLPGRNISSASEVVVGARWSNNGQALPQSGDLEAISDPLSLPIDGAVNLVINRVR